MRTNPKPEILNPKQILPRNPKDFRNSILGISTKFQRANPKSQTNWFGTLEFRYWDLFRISNLEFRICIYLVFIYGLWTMGCFAEDFKYSSKGKRDPFIPLVGPYAVYQVKGAVEIKSIGDVNLEGIVYDAKSGSNAIINSMILKEGDQVGVVVVEKIEPKKVILVIEEKRYEVLLGGEKKGGE